MYKNVASGHNAPAKGLLYEDFRKGRSYNCRELLLEEHWQILERWHVEYMIQHCLPRLNEYAN